MFLSIKVCTIAATDSHGKGIQLEDVLLKKDYAACVFVNETQWTSRSENEITLE